MTRIAVVGAGLSGLVVARSLGASRDVTVFEKSRGVGGRMATRRAGQWVFDHGTQFFTARSDGFREFLAPLIRAGVVAPWNAVFAEFRGGEIVAIRDWDESYPHYVASPGMNALGKALADGVDVRTNIRVASVEKRAAGWVLNDPEGRPLGEFDWLISTAPGAQSATLTPPDSPLFRHADEVRMPGCFALLLGFETPPDLAWQAALVRDADISWVSVNSSKPGRDSAFSVVVHSTNAWAEQHMEADSRFVEARMLRSASAVIGVDAAAAEFRQLHRWRYANPAKQGPAPQVDADRRLAACGDWFVRGRVEGAYTSAYNLVRELAQLI